VKVPAAVVTSTTDVFTGTPAGLPASDGGGLAGLSPVSLKDGGRVDAAGVGAGEASSSVDPTSASAEASTFGCLDFRRGIGDNLQSADAALRAPHDRHKAASYKPVSVEGQEYRHGTSPASRCGCKGPRSL
jgi:hypothetical protein